MNLHVFMQSRWRKYGLIFGVWTVVVIVEAAQHYASQFVENAIRHGIEPREDTGRVRIAARRLNGMLESKVSDNGPGLPETEVAPRREGVGLSNTRWRLSHLYGAHHQFELTPAAGGGLEARLLIPCRTEACERAPKVVIVGPGEAKCGADGREESAGGQPIR